MDIQSTQPVRCTSPKISMNQWYYSTPGGLNNKFLLPDEQPGQLNCPAHRWSQNSNNKLGFCETSSCPSGNLVLEIMLSQTISYCPGWLCLWSCQAQPPCQGICCYNSVWNWITKSRMCGMMPNRHHKHQQTPNGCTTEDRDWISNFIPHFIMDVITYPCWDYS